MDQSVITLLFSFAFLSIGLIGGWLGAERFLTYMNTERHDFEDLFQNNPHPELFDSEGNIDRGDYMAITFEPGFDPENFNPDEDIEYFEED
tara:strand:+ start:184 stop:456 length:273 start_codon:yes stop_codon:yes gene_type:complete